MYRMPQDDVVDVVRDNNASDPGFGLPVTYIALCRAISRIY